MSIEENKENILEAVPIKEKIGILTALRQLEKIFDFKLPDHLIKDMLAGGFDGACKILSTIGDNNKKIVETFTNEYSKYEHERLKIREKNKNDIIEYIQSNNEITLQEKINYIKEIYGFYELEERKSKRIKAAVAVTAITTVGGVATSFVLRKPITQVGKVAVKHMAKVKMVDIKTARKNENLKIVTEAVLRILNK